MAEIHLLDKSVAELIAAGEVVERPASVIKELLENAIDAGSTQITVEIKNGGITFMRVMDNGCGIAREDVETAFLRHATSKISTNTDLDHILTLGFRGEALAAVSSVSNVTIVTKTAEATVGTQYTVSGGVGGAVCDCGCPAGTSITVQDLFFNTPARMKFLKKDVTEGNAVATVVERLALSHPEIAFKFLREGKTVLTTAGDGKPLSAIYSVCGRQFASGLLEVHEDWHGVQVTGYISRPVCCKPNRNSQYVFLNGRFIKSATVSAALDQAYKHSAMVGKFPAAVLALALAADMVDVNVHPAKTEVRFSNEKLVFDAVYSAVKNALLSKDERPEFTVKSVSPVKMPVQEFNQLGLEHKPNEQSQIKAFVDHIKTEYPNTPPQPAPLLFHAKDILSAEPANANTVCRPEKDFLKKEPPAASQKDERDPAPVLRPQKPMPAVQYIGEIFATYILAQAGEDVYLIDKHAAHERILYNQLKNHVTVEQQLLLTPEVVLLSAADYGTILENAALIKTAGFDLEDFGNGNIIVRSIPACLDKVSLLQLLEELAENLRKKYTTDLERLDHLFHSMACKAAIKAGFRSDKLELAQLAQTVLQDQEIMYCPHGRPVAVKLTRTFIEKQFGRIQ